MLVLRAAGCVGSCRTRGWQGLWASRSRAVGDDCPVGKEVENQTSWWSVFTGLAVRRGACIDRLLHLGWKGGKLNFKFEFVAQ